MTAILFLGACSGDDDDESSDGGDAGTETSEQEATEPAGDDAAEGDAAGEGDEAAAGGDQAFCEWFTSVGPVPTDWDMEEAASMTPPAAIAEPFQAILDGTSSLSDESEVTRWATENCF